MNKKIIKNGLLALLSATFLGSCSQGETANLDDYEIKEGETKTAQLIAYLDTPTNIDVLKPRFTMPSWHYEDGAIFFNDWNAFSKEETALFAKKYGYSLDLYDDYTRCSGSNLLSYNRHEDSAPGPSYELVTDKITGTVVVPALIGDLKEYKIISKLDEKKSFTVYASVSPLTVSVWTVK